MKREIKEKSIAELETWNSYRVKWQTVCEETLYEQTLGDLHKTTREHTWAASLPNCSPIQKKNAQPWGWNDWKGASAAFWDELKQAWNCTIGGKLRFSSQ